MIKLKELVNFNNFEELQVMSLARLQNIVEHMIQNCALNKKDPNTVPVIVKDEANYDSYLLSTVGLSIGKPWILSLQFYGNDKDKIDYFEGEDKKPKVGEYWRSRGPSSFDVSGFVVSKEAGERLLQMVKNVLGKDKFETRLDWRKFEPNWIQFKFSTKEFDVNKLDELTKESGIITEEILKICAIKAPSSQI